MSGETSLQPNIKPAASNQSSLVALSPNTHQNINPVKVPNSPAVVQSKNKIAELINSAIKTERELWISFEEEDSRSLLQRGVDFTRGFNPTEKYEKQIQRYQNLLNRLLEGESPDNVFNELKQLNSQIASEASKSAQDDIWFNETVAKGIQMIGRDGITSTLALTGSPGAAALYSQAFDLTSNVSDRYQKELDPNYTNPQMPTDSTILAAIDSTGITGYKVTAERLDKLKNQSLNDAWNIGISYAGGKLTRAFLGKYAALAPFRQALNAQVVSSLITGSASLAKSAHEIWNNPELDNNQKLEALREQMITEGIGIVFSGLTAGSARGLSSKIDDATLRGLSAQVMTNLVSGLTETQVVSLASKGSFAPSDELILRAIKEATLGSVNDYATVLDKGVGTATNLQTESPYSKTEEVSEVAANNIVSGKALREIQQKNQAENEYNNQVDHETLNDSTSELPNTPDNTLTTVENETNANSGSTTIENDADIDTSKTETEAETTPTTNAISPSETYSEITQAVQEATSRLQNKISKLGINLQAQLQKVLSNPEVDLKLTEEEKTDAYLVQAQKDLEGKHHEYQVALKEATEQLQLAIDNPKIKTLEKSNELLERTTKQVNATKKALESGQVGLSLEITEKNDSELIIKHNGQELLGEGILPGFTVKFERSGDTFALDPRLGSWLKKEVPRFKNKSDSEIVVLLLGFAKQKQELKLDMPVNRIIRNKEFTIATLKQNLKSANNKLEEAQKLNKIAQKKAEGYLNTQVNDIQNHINLIQESFEKVQNNIQEQVENYRNEQSVNRLSKQNPLTNLPVEYPDRVHAQLSYLQNLIQNPLATTKATAEVKQIAKALISNQVNYTYQAIAGVNGRVKMMVIELPNTPLVNKAMEILLQENPEALKHPWFTGEMFTSHIKTSTKAFSTQKNTLAFLMPITNNEHSSPYYKTSYELRQKFLETLMNVSIYTTENGGKLPQITDKKPLPDYAETLELNKPQTQNEYKLNLELQIKETTQKIQKETDLEKRELLVSELNKLAKERAELIKKSEINTSAENKVSKSTKDSWPLLRELRQEVEKLLDGKIIISANVSDIQQLIALADLQANAIALKDSGVQKIILAHGKGIAQEEHLMVDIPANINEIGKAHSKDKTVLVISCDDTKQFNASGKEGWLYKNGELSGEYNLENATETILSPKMGNERLLYRPTDEGINLIKNPPEGHTPASVIEEMRKSFPERPLDLSETDLSNLNLEGAWLTKAYLAEANLRGTNLRGAHLQKADLRRADLMGADLMGGNLFGADLFQANLRGTNLMGASLKYAWLNNASLRGISSKTFYKHLKLISPGVGKWITFRLPQNYDSRYYNKDISTEQEGRIIKLSHVHDHILTFTENTNGTLSVRYKDNESIVPYTLDGQTIPRGLYLDVEFTIDEEGNISINQDKSRITAKDSYLLLQENGTDFQSGGMSSNFLKSILDNIPCVLTQEPGQIKSPTITIRDFNGKVTSTQTPSKDGITKAQENIRHLILTGRLVDSKPIKDENFIE